MDAKLPFEASLGLIEVTQTEHVSVNGFVYPQQLYYSYDFQLAATTEVLAIADGTVHSVVNNVPDGNELAPLNWRDDPGAYSQLGPGATGNQITIYHESLGLYVTYAHLAEGSIPFSEDQPISQGDPIGRIGLTGSGTAPHLHITYGSEDVGWGASTSDYFPPTKIADGSIAKNPIDFSLPFEEVSGALLEEGEEYRSNNFSEPPPDGPQQSVDTELVGGVALGVVGLEAPTYTADGDIAYRVSLAGIGPGTQYNIAYIIDVSGSMSGQQIADAKAAYIELTNQLTELGIADVANFAVIPFNSSSTLFESLTAEEAIDRISLLNAGGGTSFGPALANAEQFFASSTAGQTNVAYFLSDGQGGGASDSLTNIANVQAFGIGAGADLVSLDIIDSDNAVFLASSSQLLNVLTGSSIDPAEIDRIEIYLDGQLVETIDSSQLTDSPLGLQFTGSLSGLDTGDGAVNVITAKVYIDDGAFGGEAEISVASALNETSVTEDNGTTNVIFGAFDTTFDAGSLGIVNVSLLGNDLDNTILAEGAGGTFRSFGGNDLFLLGNHALSTVDRVIDGGSGFDIVSYTSSFIADLVEKVGSVLKIGANTDSLTNVEEVHFADAILDVETLNVTFVNVPPVAADDVFIIEGGDDLVGNVLADNGNGPDSDANADPLVVEAASFTTPAGGSVSLQEDGGFTYDPAKGFLGSDSFDYTLKDDEGESDIATVTIDVELPGDAIVGSDNDDFIRGSHEDDFILAKGGRDVAFGRHGDDTLIGGEGRDYLRGGSGDDVLIGGTDSDRLSGGRGDDTLIGGEGRNWFFGGRGDDTYVFEADTAYDSPDLFIRFFGVSGDSMDLRDLLEGYDPESDALTDFVDVSGKWFSRTVSVDADGGGDSFVPIATVLFGFWGGSSEQELVDNGTLVVA